MATGGEHVTGAAAGEETPPRKAGQGADTELEAPSGWRKKLNPIRAGKFEVIFVALTGEEIKSKRALAQYLKAHPGGPALSEFNWGTGNTPRRSSGLSEKVKATESLEDEKPAKRQRPSSSEKRKKGKHEDAEEAPAESGDHIDAEEAKGTEMELKDADNAQEDKEEATDSQEEKKESDTAQAEKDVPVVDAAEKTEEAQVETVGSELPQGAGAAGKTEEAKVDTSSPKKRKKGKQEDAEEAAAESGDHVDAEEAKGTDVEMKDADNAQEEKKAASSQEEKKESDTAQTEKKDVPMVDAAEKTEEPQVEIVGSELPKGADAAGKTEEAKVNTEVPVLPEGAYAAGKTEEAKFNVEVSEVLKGADAAGKTEEAEITIELLELPMGADAAEKTEETEGNAEFSVLPSDVSAPVSENKGDGKPAESEVAPLEGEKTENGLDIESIGPPSVEKKEEADSTMNPVTPPSNPTPLLPEEMIEEIFLCFPPDEATALIRVSLVSKTWIQTLSSKSFRCRYVHRHGTPPLLGYFFCWPELYEPKEDDTDNPFLSTSRFAPRIPEDNEHWENIICRYITLDCRHGRVLSADLYDEGPIKFYI